jgi:glycosyltransferase involved in cell wall biosynthesis
MVSIITCTKRPGFLDALYSNFNRQDYELKELILVLHGLDGLDTGLISQDPRCTILYLPKEMPLGTCLNEAIKYASFKVIAKFDDDDYYSPNYLAEAVKVMEKHRAEVVGKQSYLVYFKKEELLAVYKPGKGETAIKETTDTLGGATLVFKKRITDSVSFPPIFVGEDSAFLDECLKQNMRVYASSPYNYIYIRYWQGHHTSDADNNRLKRYCTPLLRTKNLAYYASSRAGGDN